MQVLSETANVASKRLALLVSEIRKLITALEAMCRVEIISLATIHTALDVREQYSFSWHDNGGILGMSKVEIKSRIRRMCCQRKSPTAQFSNFYPTGDKGL